jgi:hypothetical protein
MTRQYQPSSEAHISGMSFGHVEAIFGQMDGPLVLSFTYRWVTPVVTPVAVFNSGIQSDEKLAMKHVTSMAVGEIFIVIAMSQASCTQSHVTG